MAKTILSESCQDDLNVENDQLKLILLLHKIGLLFFIRLLLLLS